LWNLAVTTQIKFRNVYASNALKTIFNYGALSRRDREESDAFKVLELRILMNNNDMSDFI
jgi:hypothetical protein